MLALSRNHPWVAAVLGIACATASPVTGVFTALAGGAVSCSSLVVATGGKSIPKMGATAYGYRVAEAFGLPLVETRPALVPLTFAEQELGWMRPLAGVSLPGRVSCGRTGFDEAVLFTHRGLSGPAVLQASSFWRRGEAIEIVQARPFGPLGEPLGGVLEPA